MAVQVTNWGFSSSSLSVFQVRQAAYLVAAKDQACPAAHLAMVRVFLEAVKDQEAWVGLAAHLAMVRVFLEAVKDQEAWVGPVAVQVTNQDRLAVNP